MDAKTGDTIVIESERAAQPPRRGTIEEVLQKEPARFRIRWEDGHESILTPSAGVARIEAKRKTKTRARG
jgi:hypothetical protein